MKRNNLVALCVAVLVTACASFPAAADTVTATWTNPVKNTDDTDIPGTGAGSLTSARIAWSVCSAPGVFGTEVGFITRTMPVASVSFNLQPGDWCVRVTVQNTYGVSSDPSNVGTHVTPAPQPKAATGVTVVRTGP
jgi:hypothetical protein